MPLSLCGPLGGGDGTRGHRFVSLQLGSQADEAIVPPQGLDLECPLNESCDVADTAAVIANLDLVITVDTMVAHLAGAMGHPVWTLLRHAADWRWEQDPVRSAWYPSMHLFRQGRSEGWPELLQRVAAALERWSR
jgi:ADP-heptose:LPS heptosyltransferase